MPETDIFYKDHIAANRFGLAEARVKRVANLGGAEVWIANQLLMSPANLRFPTFDTTGPLSPSAPGAPNHNEINSDNFFIRLQYLSQSTTPVLDRLAMFWANHFTVSGTLNTVRRFIVPFEFEAIRPNLTGTFDKLCFSATTHVAMLVYLGNQFSQGPNSSAGKRGDRGLNENLGRELLELHTVGREGGYTQADVENLSKILSGWGIASNTNTVAEFVPARHEPGPLSVMGKTYPDVGKDQLALVIKDLARSRATADFIALKLCRYMVRNNLQPQNAMVRAVADTFYQTKGDLLQVYNTLFGHPMAWSPLEPSAQNVRTPDDWVVAIHRVIDFGNVTDPLNPSRALIKKFQLNGVLGQEFGRAPGPDGWSNDPVTWITPDSVFNKVKFATALAEFVPDESIDGAEGIADMRSKIGAFMPNQNSLATRRVISEAFSKEQAATLALLAPEFLRRA